MIAIILFQTLGPEKGLAQSMFKLPVGKVEASIFNVSSKQINGECLTKALEVIRDLYSSKKIEPLTMKSELTTDHETIKGLRSKPHVVLPIENSKIKLAITLLNDGNIIVPLEGDWKPGETYKWYSVSGKSTGISSCSK